MLESPHLEIPKPWQPELAASSNVGRRELSKTDEFMMAALDEAKRGLIEGGILESRGVQRVDAGFHPWKTHLVE